jgi:hypothetical protein
MSEFLSSTLADFLGSVLAGFVLVALYVVIQWFLAATDVEIGYSWSFLGPVEMPTELRVSLDVRNRSRSRTYYLGNIAYMKAGQPVAAFDNRSVWGTELKPGTITFLESAPLRSFSMLCDCMDAEVHVRLQNGRLFWLRGSGPGQHKRGTLQRAAFWLRAKLEAGAVPVE